MTSIINAYNYILLKIEVTLYNIFADDGRRSMKDYEVKPWE